MSGPGVFFTEDKLSWLTMVKDFSEHCRIFERLVEEEIEPEERKELWCNIVLLADYFDKHKKERKEELFENSCNCYDAQNTYEQDCKGRFKPSMRHFVEQIDAASIIKYDATEKVLPLNSEIKNLERAFDLRKKYLKTFFGIEYKKAKTEVQKFQVFQLLLILFRCEQKTKRGILKEISGSSFWRFRIEEENPYRNAIDFIRSELLKSLSFKDAAAITYFAGQIRSCMYSVAEFIVNTVIKAKRLNAAILDNEIRLELQRRILSNLKELNALNKTEVLEKNMEDFFWRAYLHFLLLGIEDSIDKPYLHLSLQELWEDKPTWLMPPIKMPLIDQQRREMEITRRGCCEEELSDRNIVLDNLKSFINEEVEFISRRALGESNAALRKTIKRYNDDGIYFKLARLYCDYKLRPVSDGISLNELLGCIFLFHACVQRETGNSKLTSRKGSYHGGEKRRQEMQIRSILNDVYVTLDNKIDFRDDEVRWYELASFMNTLDSMLKNELDEMVENRRQISEEMLVYLIKIVPLSPEVPRKYKDITEIADSIVSKDTLEQYCRWKEKKKGIELFNLIDEV